MNFDEFRKYFDDSVINKEKIICQNNIRGKILYLLNNFSFDILKQIIAVDKGENNTELIYHLFSSEEKEDVLLSITVQGEAETITDIFPSAIADENEIFDLFGIKFIGNEDIKRLYMPEDWEGFPLRKDYIESDERLAWNDSDNT